MRARWRRVQRTTLGVCIVKGGLRRVTALGVCIVKGGLRRAAAR
jgi:hypothetical protein